MNRLDTYFTNRLHLSAGILSCLLVFNFSGWLVAQTSAPLPRRITLGVQAKAVTADTQQRLKLRNTRGAEVVAVIPDSTAAVAGLKPGDVILEIANQPVTNVGSLIQLIGEARTGTELSLKLKRDNDELVLNCEPKPLAQESSGDLDIEYGQVVTPQGRLRTVSVAPKGGGTKQPGVLLLAGLGLGSVEHPQADPLGMKTIAHALARKGLTVLRVDRPGCGDSEGGPARDADFQTIVEGYVAAAKALKTMPSVDPDNLTLLGFSAGALEAPLVAEQVPVKNIAVFGSLNVNWQDYIQSTTRRQLRLSGVNAGDIEQLVSLQSAAWHYLIFEELAPDDIASAHEKLSEWVDENWDDGKYFSGIHYRFFQQLGRTNIAASWDKFDGRILTLWGDADVVTSKEEHEWIASIAIRKKIGQGKFQTITGIDHNLQSPDAANNPGSPNPLDALVEAVSKWIKPE